MAITNKPWDGSASRWPDTPSYCRDCLINENTGDPKTWTQDKCHLPVYEPGSHDLNANAVRNALARISQLAGVSGAAKQKAMSKLMALRKQAKIGQS